MQDVWPWLKSDQRTDRTYALCHATGLFVRGSLVFLSRHVEPLDLADRQHDSQMDASTNWGWCLYTKSPTTFRVHSGLPFFKTR